MPSKTPSRQIGCTFFESNVAHHTRSMCLLIWRIQLLQQKCSPVCGGHVRNRLGARRGATSSKMLARHALGFLDWSPLILSDFLHSSWNLLILTWGKRMTQLWHARLLWTQCFLLIASCCGYFGYAICPSDVALTLFGQTFHRWLCGRHHAHLLVDGAMLACANMHDEDTPPAASWSIVHDQQDGGGIAAQAPVCVCGTATP